MTASVVAVAGLAFVARTAAVELGKTALWPGNPAVLSARIMSDVGQAAARGEAPNEQTLARLEKLAAKEPLTAQPFLIHGAMAARTGNFERAETLLSIARQRAPRSAAARYLMADLYLRTNRPVAAMAEMAVLNRLLPAGSLQLAPSLAAYARVPGSIPRIKAILESYPELEEPLLAQMSADAASTEAVLRLASPRAGDGRAPVWQGMLLSNLVAQGQYQKAFTTWRRLSGGSGGPGELKNPQFDASNAPPPFNWRFAEGAGAVVQPSSGGLEVVYFGRDNLAFVEQVVLLPPGRHRLAMNVSGSFANGSGIAWRVKCLPDGAELMKLPLTAAGPLSGEFMVPSTCKAQSIGLTGEMSEVPVRTDFRVSGVQLTPAPGG